MTTSPQTPSPAPASAAGDGGPRPQRDPSSGFDATEIAAEATSRCEDPLSTVLGQALGAASACWENLRGAGIFESTRAAAILDETERYVRAYVAGAAAMRAAQVVRMVDGDRLVLVVDQVESDGEVAELLAALRTLEAVLRGEAVDHADRSAVAIAVPGLQGMLVASETVDAQVTSSRDSGGRDDG